MSYSRCSSCGQRTEILRLIPIGTKNYCANCYSKALMIKLQSKYLKKGDLHAKK